MIIISFKKQKYIIEFIKNDKHRRAKSTFVIIDKVGISQSLTEHILRNIDIKKSNLHNLISAIKKVYLAFAIRCKD